MKEVYKSKIERPKRRRLWDLIWNRQKEQNAKNNYRMLKGWKDGVWHNGLRPGQK